MSVYKDTAGRWRYRIVVKRHDGSKVRISGTPEINTRAAAQSEERADIERSKAAAVLMPMGPAYIALPPTVAEFSSEWIGTYCTGQANRASTVTEKQGHLRLYILPALGALRLDEVTEGRLAEFKASIGARLSAKTVRNVFQNLAKMLRCAVAWGKLGAVPKMPAIKLPRAKFDFYSEAEVLKLLSCEPSESARLEILFAVDTGARVSEQIAIEWEDIDWENRSIWIRRQRHKGVTGPTKTGVERRIDMTRNLEKALRDLQAVRSSSTGPIFTDLQGRPMAYSHFLWTLRQATTRAGVKLLNWHGLRHTFASHLIMRGTPIRWVQRYLGHASIVTTERYSHVLDTAGASFIKHLEARGTALP